LPEVACLLYLFGRQDDFLSMGRIAALDAVSDLGDVPRHISQICEDLHLEALLTDDVDNLSVRFQRVKVTGEDISGVKHHHHRHRHHHCNA